MPNNDRGGRRKTGGPYRSENPFFTHGEDVIVTTDEAILMPKIFIVAVTAMLSLSLLFFLFRRLRKRQFQSEYINYENKEL